MEPTQLASYARCFINGDFVMKTEETFKIYNPTTGKVLVEEVQQAGAKEVDAAVAAAQAAYPGWAKTEPAKRAESILNLARLMRESSKEIATIEALELGKPFIMGFGEVDLAAKNLDHAAHLATTYLGGTASDSTPGHLNVSLKVPYGITAGICPWNVPSIMLTAKAGPSLAAGNTIIIKSSEKSPLSAGLIAGLINKAGFPPGVLQILSGAGLTGKLLAEHMQIRAISFTGSTRTGRMVLESAARSNLKQVWLELGGKSPAIVFDDADVADAARKLSMSLWYNSGQICMASTRIYVQSQVLTPFLEEYTKLLKNTPMGDPSDQSTLIGPLADQIQYNSVQKYIDSAFKTGKAVIGGDDEHKRTNGFFIGPHIFTNVAADAQVNKEEVFGPVVVVHAFEDEESVIHQANDSEYGLFASVFTKDIDRALRLAKRLDAGNVAINCTSPMGASDMEFGGTKQSGVGREGGPRALENWLETKSIYIAVKDL